MAERDQIVCPFCRAEFPVGFGPAQMCSGPFLDRDHPSAVRPIFLPAHLSETEREKALTEARATYGGPTRG